ncbi:hypothetical protein EG68_10180 [Paragonimus skrjabini miyazakii]|uniref:Uncharacterized protein n=1 Tax=Paragonimus skrjabini miyazakii TaxID=59628 RepID=A0A8S9YLR9_9TREM|nr:hypothetical protein EG68_10180 [Paragonimus skrjabini miyazakii]
MQAALIGFLIFLLLWKILLPLLRVFWVYTIGKRLFSRRRFLKGAGEWAIVTGSTDGIGKAYAHELAKDGLNVMLISRNQNKLDAVAQELESTFNVKTKVVVCDFTKTDIYDMLDREISALSSISCLVNNVGMSYPSFDTYADADFLSLEFIRQLISCNVNSVASLTRIVLPKLLKQGRCGTAIINLSSFSGLVPFPYLTLYSACKSFVHHFSESLRCELRNSDVCVQSVCPLLVATAMSKVRNASFFVPSPAKFAASALDMLGVEETTVGCVQHALQSFLLTIHPGIVTWISESKYKKTKHRKTQ